MSDEGTRPDERDKAARRWREVEAIFAEALSRAPSEQEAYLDDACGDDPDLRSEVMELLVAHGATGLFDHVVGKGSEEGTPDGPPGAAAARGVRVGPYAVQEVLGEGGMGVVYLARRADGHFDLEVALKVLPVGSASPRLRQRFLAERQILARLSHPNVARLLDGGVDETGRPFFAMERVRGRPILRHCDEERLNLRQRLDLFLLVCDAVQHAHQNLVVHRDLKPGNILVDESGQPKLLDFGIAKLLDPAAHGPASQETEVGVRVLTPSYAAPEQLRGEPANTATDIYQLGILLFELLTGVHPFADADGWRTSADLSLSDRTSVRPSTTFGDHGSEDVPARAHRRRNSSDHLRRQLEGDLDAIVLKALRPEPERRYRSAAELADDIRRHLERRPVRARPDTWGYRSGRFVRRNAVAVGVAAAVVLGGVAFTAGIAREARRTALERDRAEAVSRFMTDLFANADPFVADGEELTVRDLLAEGAQRARVSLRDQPAIRATLLEVIGDAYWELGVQDQGLALRQEALGLRRGLGDDGDPAASARAAARIGRYLVAAGEFEGGRLLLDEAEAFLQTLDPDARLHRAKVANDLGLAWQMMGAYDRAEPFLEEAALGFGRLPGEGSATAAVLGNLAWLRLERSDPDSAEVLFRSALALRREALGPNHLSVANTLGGLGSLFIRQGDIAGADSAFRESLRIRRNGLGDDHHLTVTSVLGLARVVARSGRPSEADSLFQAAIVGLETSLGPDHFAVGNARNDRAIFLRDQGRTAEAVQEFARAERLYRSAFGDGHLSPSIVGANLAWAHFLDGRPDEAVAWYERVMPHILAADSSSVRSRGNQIDYGIALCRTSRASEGVDVLQDGVRALDRHAPHDDQGLRGRNALGECLGLLKRFEEAEATLLDVLDRTEARGEDDPYRAFARRTLADVYEAWARPEDASRVVSGR